MERKEYIKTIVYNGHMINLGDNDNGQCYVLEYIDPRTGQLRRFNCGIYNKNYMAEVRAIFGTPDLCDHSQNEQPCPNTHAHEYCYKCPKNEDYEMFHRAGRV